MAKHVTARAHWWASMSISGGLLSWIKDNLDPLFLLGFDDATGSSIFADSSGNGNDFTINGTPTLEAGTDTLFSGAGQSMDIDASAERGTRDGIATTGTSWTIAGIYTPETTNPSLRIYDNILDSGASTARCLFYQFTGAMKCTWPSGNISATSRAINASGWTGLIALNAEGSEGAFFENGIEYARFTVATGAMLGGALRTVAWGDYALAGANPALGKHSMAMLNDAAVNALQHYNLWKQATGGLTHYWFETLGSLKSGTRATATSPQLPPSSLIFHAPLWEEAGAQAIDVSGNENHGTYFGGPSLGQTPLGDGAVYSAALNGSTQYLDADAAVVDTATTDWTASLRFTSTNTGNVGLFGMTAGGLDYIILWLDTATGYLKGQAVEGGAGVSLVIGSTDLRDGLPHNVVIRWTVATRALSIFEDGVLIGTVTRTNAPSTPTRCEFGDVAHVTLTPLLGNIEVPTIFNASLADAECVILSGGAAPTPASITAEATTDGAAHLFLTNDTGTTLVDSMGNNNGAYVNSPTQNVEAYYGMEAFTSVGASNKSAGVTSSTVDINDFSYVVRFRTTDATGVVVSVGANATSNWALLYFSAGSLIFRSFDGSTTCECNASAGYNDGKWHTVAIGAKSGQTAGMFIDGFTSIGSTFNHPTFTASKDWEFGDTLHALGGIDGDISTIEMYASKQTNAFLLAKTGV